MVRLAVFSLVTLNSPPIDRHDDSGRCRNGQPIDLPAFLATEFLGHDISRDETEPARYGDSV